LSSELSVWVEAGVSSAVGTGGVELGVVLGITMVSALSPEVSTAVPAGRVAGVVSSTGTTRVDGGWGGDTSAATTVSVEAIATCSSIVLFTDCAKTTTVEFGNNRPIEMSKVFQRIFIRRF
jgi:hypothetical protein